MDHSFDEYISQGIAQASDVPSIVLAVLGGAILLGIVCAVLFGRKGAAPTADGSYFDGSTLGLIGMQLLVLLLSLVTLGIGTPWAECMMLRWKAKHTVINGRRLQFTGKGLQLLGKYLLWALLTVVTLGIYAIWLPVKAEKWRVRHTVYAQDSSGFESEFTGSTWGWIWNSLICGLITLVTFGIGFSWAQVRFMRWRYQHTQINGSPLIFGGTGGQYFVKNLLCVLLTPLTLGIYAIFFPVIIMRWEASHTVALYRTPDIRRASLFHETSAGRDAAQFRVTASETELALLRQGIRGNEAREELEELAASGSPYAKYQLALLEKGKEPAFTGAALAMLKEAAEGGYHPAQRDYALAAGTGDPATYVNMLMASARGGNLDAPYLLCEFLRRMAQERRDQDLDSGVDMLQQAAYWFKVALEQGNPQALARQGEYPQMVDTIALWKSRQVALPAQSGCAGVFLLVFIGILVAGGIALGVNMLSGTELNWRSPENLVPFRPEPSRAEWVAMSDLVGYTKENAYNYLSVIDLDVFFTAEVTESRVPGLVARQNYPAGTPLEAGTTVILWITELPSAGETEAPVTVPETTTSEEPAPTV